MNLLIAGASRGLGCSLAEAAVKEGHTVFAGVRNQDRISEQLKDLNKKHETRCRLIQLDVSDEDSVEQAAKETGEHCSSLDIIINNAAILLGRERKIEDVEFQEMERALDTNLLGPMRVVKHFLPMLRKGSQPFIANISSEAGAVTKEHDNDYPYGLSKAALNKFTMQLHCYLHSDGIGVCSIHPGWMHTDMGGEQAPLNPAISAQGILDIVTRKTPVDSPYQFINYEGKPMKI
ncbi:SDR family oxidoreductase [Fictibacillus fluitans]|uniref:SDR family oxidoreductase n=1 Tax=Fictibacillus fluitans TaxID=3058422 RepID=A0ABT8HTR4_9BACL|nr:SDR family oxidoreductase [Fictibacillus sp. NE201]MDN4524158.1 SDR family oxidoreductase [Fictibacillus sp. NE201]